MWVRVVPDRSEPGREVRLQVSAAPNSTVALLGVDQKVLLLDNKNRLTKDTVRAERLSYDPTDQRRSWGGFSTAYTDETFEVTRTLDPTVHLRTKLA